MQEIIFTIIVFFILFRVFRPKVHIHYHNSNKHNHYHEAPKPDGKVKIDHMPNANPANKGSHDGEYVEYEEVK